MLVVRDRPYSSYSSSRGGWNWGAFGKCLLVAVAVMAIDFAVEYLIDPTMPGDGAAAFNERKRAKLERKEQKKRRLRGGQSPQPPAPR